MQERLCLRLHTTSSASSLICRRAASVLVIRTFLATLGVAVSGVGDINKCAETYFLALCTVRCRHVFCPAPSLAPCLCPFNHPSAVAAGLWPKFVRAVGRSRRPCTESAMCCRATLFHRHLSAVSRPRLSRSCLLRSQFAARDCLIESSDLPDKLFS